MGTGILLIAGALILTLYNVWVSRQAGQRAALALEQLERRAWAEARQGHEAPKEPEEGIQIQGQSYIGVLSLPGLNLRLPIISQWSYDSLRTAPCRYGGTPYQGNLILAGHNYARHFGGIRSMKPGDRVSFTDLAGNRFDYQVAAEEILDPDQGEKIWEGNWDLTLFTCTYGGQNRFVLRCVRTGFQGEQGKSG